MKVYYAHSLHLYGTAQERRDIELLQSLGFEVVNPSNEEHQGHCDFIRNVETNYDEGSRLIMEYFKEVVDKCDMVAFRAHVDGKIPGGVGIEVKKALLSNKPVIELPTFLNSRFLTKEETREYLKYMGQR